MHNERLSPKGKYQGMHLSYETFSSIVQIPFVAKVIFEVSVIKA